MTSPKEKLLSSLDKNYEGLRQTADPIRYLDTGIRRWNRMFVGGPGGGLPCCTVVTLWGPDGSGKSTVALQVARYVQAQKKTVVWVDAENAFDTVWASAIGLDYRDENDYWIYLGPASMENTFGYLNDLLEGARGNPDIDIGLIVLDSHNALQVDSNWSKDIADASVAGEARFFANQFGRFIYSLSRSPNTAFLTLGQVRANFNATTFGAKDILGAPKALRHRIRAAHRIDRIGTAISGQDGDEAQIVRISTKAQSTKHSVGGGKRGQEVQMTMHTDVNNMVGIDDAEDLVWYAAQIGLLTNGQGNEPNDTSLWFYHKGQEDEVQGGGKGSKAMIARLIEDPAFYEKLDAEVAAIDEKCRQARAEGKRVDKYGNITE